MTDKSTKIGSVEHISVELLKDKIQLEISKNESGRGDNEVDQYLAGLGTSLDFINEVWPEFKNTKR